MYGENTLFSMCFVLYTMSIKKYHTTINISKENELQISERAALNCKQEFPHKEDEASDPNVVSMIRDQWIVGPSNQTLNLASPSTTHYSQYNQSAFIDELLHQRRAGFFIEAGAADGERFSNSLFFEKYRGWSGLLVEANPKTYSILLTRNRQNG